MDLCIYDPPKENGQTRNGYLSEMYFDSIRNWCNDSNIPISQLTELKGCKNKTILAHGEWLTPSTIIKLRDSGNKIISFDINDSSHLMDEYRNDKEFAFINLIFKVSGIQKENINSVMKVDEEFNFVTEEKKFMSDSFWNIYHLMHLNGSLQSLPYVPWKHLDGPKRSYSERSSKALFRGGNHFYRFIAFLYSVKSGIADPRSSFSTYDRFTNQMPEQFRYCDSCCDNFRRNGKVLWQGGGRPSMCKSPAEWGSELDFSGDAWGLWNNKCPRSFLWLVEQFEKKYGPVDREIILKALSGKHDSEEVHAEAIAQSSFYCDLKWWPSIYVPPRFWEAAGLGTINLLPARANEQEYFPAMALGVHYHSFEENFSDFDFCDSNSFPEFMNEVEFQYVSQNAMDLYDGWVRPGKYRISERLCRHIINEIEKVSVN